MTQGVLKVQQTWILKEKRKGREVGIRHSIGVRLGAQGGSFSLCVTSSSGALGQRRDQCRHNCWKEAKRRGTGRRKGHTAVSQSCGDQCCGEASTHSSEKTEVAWGEASGDRELGQRPSRRVKRTAVRGHGVTR